MRPIDKFFKLVKVIVIIAAIGVLYFFFTLLK